MGGGMCRSSIPRSNIFRDNSWQQNSRECGNCILGWPSVFPFLFFYSKDRLFVGLCSKGEVIENPTTWATVCFLKCPLEGTDLFWRLFSLSHRPRYSGSISIYFCVHFWDYHNLRIGLSHRSMYSALSTLSQFPQTRKRCARCLRRPWNVALMSTSWRR